MKILKRVAIIVGSLLAAVVLAVVAIFAFISYRGAHYYDFVQTNEPIEQRFTAMGPLKVNTLEVPEDATTSSEQRIWYPADDEEADQLYPLVAIANGTGVTASSYTAVFEHLASWGFIVVGNEDDNSRTGESTLESVNFALALNEDEGSALLGKIDAEHLGVAGHSQGGVGAINAAISSDAETQFSAVFTESTTSPYWGQEDVFGSDWSFDASQLNVPTFMTAGTGDFDAGTASDITATEGQGIAPLWSLQQTYDAIPDTVDKGFARRVDTDHSENLHHSDGYMTAWFRYWLQSNVEAGQAFVGEGAEITENSIWQDVTKNF